MGNELENYINRHMALEESELLTALFVNCYDGNLYDFLSTGAGKQVFEQLSSTGNELNWIKDTLESPPQKSIFVKGDDAGNARVRMGAVFMYMIGMEIGDLVLLHGFAEDINAFAARAQLYHLSRIDDAKYVEEINGMYTTMILRGIDIACVSSNAGAKIYDNDFRSDYGAFTDFLEGLDIDLS